MTFKQAKKKLAKIAAGRYHMLSYELTENDMGELSQKCQVYVDPGIMVTGKTWGEALAKIERLVLGKKPEIIIEDIGNLHEVGK